MRGVRTALLVAAAFAVGPAAALSTMPVGDPRPPESLRASLVAMPEGPGLRRLVAEALDRNPEIAAAAARARAAARRAPLARALPDPEASLTAFLAPPETRAGPQRLSASLSQTVPWPGQRALRGRAAELDARGAGAVADVHRLAVATEVRRLYYELSFLARHHDVVEELGSHLAQHEEIARARYATGVGLGQAVIHLQAEITRAEKELLDIASRRAGLLARLNGLCDRPSTAILELEPLPEVVERPLQAERLAALAIGRRPELAAAGAALDRARTATRLAEREDRPDLRFGLTYTLVTPRDDLAAGLRLPDDGDDVFGIVGGVRLPVRRRKLAASMETAAELERAAAEELRRAAAQVASEVAELAHRVPLDWRRLRLVEDLLIVQARESLESAQAAYVAGRLGALDLLDAEHVLFEARLAAERARTDYRVGLARLEGAVGGPLPPPAGTFPEGDER